LRISIIITVYNYEKFVAQAIDSALVQTIKIDEIIVVDDGSTDKSPQIIEAYGDKIISLIKPNGGVSDARNHGYLQSTGDIILFLDADDTLSPNALEEVIKHWSDSCAKVQFDLELIDAAGEKVGRCFCKFPNDYDSDAARKQFDKTGTYIWPVTSGNAYSRNFLKQVMPLNIGPQDGALNTIAPLYGDIITIPKSLGQYRVHSNNLSRRNKLGEQHKVPDFSYSIDIRVAEFDLLKNNAKIMQYPLPDINFLDMEMVFVNYRFIAKKLGQKYTGFEQDSKFKLLKSGIMLSLSTYHSLKAKLSNLIWFLALYAAPRDLVNKLVTLRFNRHDFYKKIIGLKAIFAF
jgi:glycosyltransferase involved in cell wall biosynthesis